MQQKSLKFKIIALTLTVILLISIVSSFILQRLISTSKEMTIADFKSNAMALQSSIAAQFYERYGDVQAFSINPAIVEMDKAKIVPFLNQYTVMYGIYDLILVINSEGKLVAVNDISPDKKTIKSESLYSKNFSEEKWFKAVMNGKFTNDEKNGFSGTFVEDPYFLNIASDVYGDQRYGSTFSAAIHNSAGKTIGVIVNFAGSRWFELEFQKLYESMKSKGLKETEMTLLDKKGVVLVDYDPALNGNDLKPQHDKEVLGKMNLVEKGLVIAQDLINKKAGAGIYMHMRKKIDQVAGYSPITDNKFIPDLGWGVIVRENKELVFEKILAAQNIFYIAIIILIVVAITLSYQFSLSIAKSLQNVASQLSTAGLTVSSAATQIASASEELSQASTEQASSLQETSSSIEEINSMINSNTENAKQSAIASQESLENAKKGQVVVGQMITAIEQINRSNDSIKDQISTSNAEIEEIVKLINEIENKTKVINDIVFQTKLLSFNASVEAARAGENGKGFAVVAEEVGNLASMSGNAAVEISTMLNNSVAKVEQIVKNSKEKVGRLMEEGKISLDAGTRVANECGQVLGQIVNSVANVSIIITEISSATQEQAQGMSEITKAIGQLDVVTQQNNSNASESANSAGELSNQAATLNLLVEELIKTIDGNHHQPLINNVKKKLAEIKKPVLKKTAEEKPKIKPLPEKKIAEHSVPPRNQTKEITPDADDARFTDV